ncbi:SafA/ExsA family spore coat assembly protein [Thermaerobacillus caldiproteolyticus]|uniref:Putative YkwD family protein/spore coat assembly protein SafA n=1 Tax=Thermaerobacillus caldiproteolyticus TaxID=247480 RepID=A0A7V9Z4Y2_9BACL|nr:SafA/ExsA family spore coat assembly protein [Anoxybacillus caldiproteolyticus]MBA2874115.1 putative YkwD family protein/spore coat assembly protein SafA [Anoxybacillus caldiproteolyticus]QPA31933.1 SafA/ExsA family spore coat assembly protein [Anoxybacillus caldiproteolyticus]
MKKYLLACLFSAMLLSVSIPQNAYGQGTTTYIVRPGDTLWKISVRYQVGLSEIIEANPQFPNPNLIYPGQKVYVPILNDVKQIENEVVRLTNQERAKYGLPPLQIDWQLARVARYKSADMRDKNYFQHDSPTYGSPFTMMKNFGISYRTAGENIAAGQRTPQEVVNAWMNSPGHRANILKKDFTHIGVGYAKGGSYGHYWTQMFIGK